MKLSKSQHRHKEFGRGSPRVFDPQWRSDEVFHASSVFHLRTERPLCKRSTHSQWSGKVSGLLLNWIPLRVLFHCVTDVISVLTIKSHSLSNAGDGDVTRGCWQWHGPWIRSGHVDTDGGTSEFLFTVNIFGLWCDKQTMGLPGCN